MRWSLPAICGAIGLAIVLTLAHGSGASAAAPAAWVSRAGLPAARAVLSAATAPDGSIYVMGGENASFVATDEVDIYHPASDTWTTGPSLPAPRDSAGAATVGHTIYLIGGFVGTDQTSTNTVLALDVDSGTWSQVASMPTARAVPAVTVGHDGLIYVIGGFDHYGSSQAGSANSLNAVEAYDPTSNTWSSLASLPGPPGISGYENAGDAGAAAVTGPDGKIYVFGGCAGPQNACQLESSIFVYDPSSPSSGWAVIDAPFATARDNPGGAVSPDGTIYAIGGAGDHDGLIIPGISSVETYTIGSSTGWSTGPSLLTGRSDFAVAAGTDGTFYAFGGSSGFGSFTSSVEALPAHTLSLSAPASATLGTPFSVTLTVSDRSGATDSGYRGTVHFSSSDSGSDVSLPADYTFTATDAGSHTFSVTLGTVGTQTISVADTSDSAISTSASIQVGKQNQTIDFAQPDDTTYGVVPFTVSASASSSLPVSFMASGQCSLTQDSGSSVGTVTIIGAGSCTIKASQAGNDQYAAAPDVSRTFQIAKATLTVTADNQTKIFGWPNPPLTFSFSGFVNDEAADVVSGAPLLSTAATTTSPVGSDYAITVGQGTLAAQNYAFKLVDGTLTITAAGSATAVDPASATFDAAGVDLSATVTDRDCPPAPTTCPAVDAGSVTFVVSDSQGQQVGSSVGGDVADGQASASFSIPSGTPAGSYTVTATFQDPAGNFSDSQGTGSLSIGQATPAITWSQPAAIVYGTPLSATQLDATADVPGSFSYTPSSGTILSAGSHTLSVLFTPSDTVDYTTATASVSIEVDPAGTTTAVLDVSTTVGASRVQLSAIISSTTPVDAGSVSFTVSDSQGHQLGTSTSGSVTNGTATAEFSLPSGTPVGSYTVSATYHDPAGNFSDSSGAGRLTIGYGIAPQYNQGQPVPRGSWAVLKLTLTDANGRNLSSGTLAVTALNLAPVGQPWDGTSGNFQRAFTFSRALAPGGGYELLVNTGTLRPGTYVLTFQVAGDPVLHTLQFSVR